MLYFHTDVYLAELVQLVEAEELDKGDDVQLNEIFCQDGNGVYVVGEGDLFHGGMLSQYRVFLT